jgi:hypothetical protein
MITEEQLHQVKIAAFLDEFQKIADMIRGVRGVMPLFGEAVKDVKGGISGIAKVKSPVEKARELVHGVSAAPAATLVPRPSAALQSVSRRAPPIPATAPGGSAAPGGLFQSVPSPFYPR